LPPLAAESDSSFYAERQGIPHGEVEEVQYKAGASKTMHVYTPPGYASDTAISYPVLYINHGGGENDTHWGCTQGYSCGYAGRILDNLIADGKAVPMLIVMPDTGDCANFDPPEPPDFEDPCTTQYVDDFIPYVEQTYRVKKDRHSRAMAGLSMGGLVTLNTGFAHLELFSHVFGYSSGYTADQRPTWETNLSGALGDPHGTNQLLNAPIYLAAGATDIALPNSQAVRDILEEHQIKVLWQDSSLGHEWGNWRRYLAQTLPLMFKNTSGCN
jgi:enterochelin esterase family protein